MLQYIIGVHTLSNLMIDGIFMPKWSPTTSVRNFSLMSRRETDLYRLKFEYPYIAISFLTVWRSYDVIMTLVRKFIYFDFVPQI